jgi:hypothetical protein
VPGFVPAAGDHANPVEFFDIPTNFAISRAPGVRASPLIDGSPRRPVCETGAVVFAA